MRNAFQDIENRFLQMEQSQEDQDLVVSIRRGDRTVFDSLYTLLYDSLLSYGTQYLQSGPEVEDIIHDVFLAVWRNRETWSPASSIRAYFLTAIRNKAIEKIRRATITNTAIQFLNLDDNSELQHIQYAEIELSERAARVQVAINSLPRKQADVLLLRWFQGLTYLEIAHILGISPQAARKMILRVQDKLKQMLSDLKDDF